MQNNAEMMESLLEKAIDYGKTSFELVKLKTLDKGSDVLSTVIPHTGVLILVASFMLLFNLGLAFWLGELFGNIAYGFFVVAAFYGLISLFIHFFLHRWFKNRIRNYIIKQMFK